MTNNVDFNYPEDLFDNLVWVHEHKVTNVPDISRWNMIGQIPETKKHQYTFHFSNGYGASVIKGPGTYGYEKDLWELAVLSERGGEWHLDYDTDITDDVIGYLSVEEVKGLIERIKNLRL